MDYIVTRLTKDGVATDRVILFHAPTPKLARTHIKRIEAISDWRHVGDITTDRDDLDLVTQTNGMPDAVLLRRTGVDVRHLRTVTI